jgi:hypothetical protein
MIVVVVRLSAQGYGMCVPRREHTQSMDLPSGVYYKLLPPIVHNK